MNEFVHDDACRPWVTHQMPSFSSLFLSSQDGGGVYVSGDGATVTFNDCQITSNTASTVSKHLSKHEVVCSRYVLPCFVLHDPGVAVSLFRWLSWMH